MFLRCDLWIGTPVFLPGESQGQRILGGYDPWGRKESDMTERLHVTSFWIYIIETYLWLALHLGEMDLKKVSLFVEDQGGRERGQIRGRGLEPAQWDRLANHRGTAGLAPAGSQNIISFFCVCCKIALSLAFLESFLPAYYCCCSQNQGYSYCAVSWMDAIKCWLGPHCGK